MGLTTSLLTQRLTLLAPTRVSNGAGGWTSTYASAGEVRGRVTAAANRTVERIRGEQATAVELVEITLRETTPVTADMRVQSSDGVFEIVQIDRQDGIAFLIGRAV